MSGGGNSERWLLTYSDLITLLMVFFVVMYAISEADKEKFLELRSSMQKAFKVDVENASSLVGSSGGAALLEAPRVDPLITGVEDSGLGQQQSAPRLPEPPPEDARIEMLRQAVLPLAEAQGVAESVNIYQGGDGTVVSLSGNLIFDSGKAELKPEGALFLKTVSGVVRPWPNRLRVEGHTDNVPLSTDLYPSNWELSSARAIVVTRYLIEREGIAAERIGAAAYGDGQPVADNGTREGRSRNRRVDILILNLGEVKVFPGEGQP